MATKTGGHTAAEWTSMAKEFEAKADAEMENPNQTAAKACAAIYETAAQAARMMAHKATHAA